MYAVSFTTLYRVDATDAALTRVGLTTATDLNALTFLADGTLLAGGGSALYEVDTATGDLTRLAAIGTWSFAGDMVGLPDGLLYCAMSEGWGSAVSLVVYDMAAREIVDTGSTGTDSLYGVAYAEETLFGFSATGDVYTLDQSTGLGTWIAAAGSVWYGATTNPVAWD
jgi:outer membrane protein assembly factor BamB